MHREAIDIAACLGNDEIVPTGTLWLHDRRASFAYHASWLAHRQAFAIDPFLPLTEGSQHTSRVVFGALADTLPDRWGKKLWQARFGKPGSEAALLRGVPDAYRMGALRLVGGEGFEGPPISLPNYPSLATLHEACQRVMEQAPTAADMAALWGGVGMGGAHPKALVMRADGTMVLAKVGSGHEAGTIQWEWVCGRLARECGIDVPEQELLQRDGAAGLFVDRFDRHGPRRWHYWSGNTLLNDPPLASYKELIQATALHATHPGVAEQLWQRMVFNFLIGNEDDHLRNHGLLRKDAGWQLAPAFDLTPTAMRYRTGKHALPMSEAGSSLAIAHALAGDLGMDADKNAAWAQEARAIIHAQWARLARQAGLKNAHITAMRGVFEGT